MRLIACRNDAGAPALGARVGDELVDLAAMGLRYPSSRVAHGEALVRPHVSTQFDYEAELVAVIGKGGRLRSPLPESPLTTPPNFLKAERILNL